MSLLEVRGLRKRFGALRAVDDVSFSMPAGSMLALVGPNGAGKSTVCALLAGFVRPNAGVVRFAGRRLWRAGPHRRAALGLVRTFQPTQPFHGLNVRDNITIAAHLRLVGRREAQAHAELIATRVGLADALDTPASQLPSAALIRLELARALATEPRLLLLDEILRGHTADEAQALLRCLGSLREAGLGVLLVERSLQTVERAQACDEALVMAAGRLVARGAPAALVRDPAVIEACLGQRAGRLLSSAPRPADAR